MADTYSTMFDRWPVNHIPTDPPRIGLPVTLSDTLDLQNSSGCPSYAKSLYIGVTGDVSVIFAGDKSNNGQGTAQKFTAHPVGYLVGQVRRVMSTGTTAQSILALMD